MVQQLGPPDSHRRRPRPCRPDEVGHLLVLPSVLAVLIGQSAASSIHSLLSSETANTREKIEDIGAPMLQAISQPHSHFSSFPAPHCIASSFLPQRASRDRAPICFAPPEQQWPPLSITVNSTPIPSPKWVRGDPAKPPAHPQPLTCNNLTGIVLLVAPFAKPSSVTMSSYLWPSSLTSSPTTTSTSGHMCS